MTFNLDLLAAKPQSESEWMLQHGDVIESDNTSHIEAVQDAIELLSPQSKFCIEAIFYEGIPYSKLGDRLGVSKPHAWRLSRKALKELNDLLINNTSINQRYTMFDNWDDASASIIKELDAHSNPIVITEHYLKEMQSGLAEAVRENALDVSMFEEVGVAACEHLMLHKMWNPEAMHKLIVGKQRDYGHQNILMFAEIGVAVRICDKIARLLTLMQNNSEPSNESILDTWFDLVGYSVVAKMLYNKTFTLNLKEQ